MLFEFLFVNYRIIEKKLLFLQWIKLCYKTKQI